MTISDIHDALTQADLPFRLAAAPERALDLLGARPAPKTSTAHLGGLSNPAPAAGRSEARPVTLPERQAIVYNTHPCRIL
jgi:hypothetical protein